MDSEGDPGDPARKPVVPPGYVVKETQHECLNNLRYTSKGDLGASVAHLIAFGFIPYEEWEDAHRGEPIWLWPICQNYNMDKAIGQLATDFTDADTPCVAPMNWEGNQDAPPPTSCAKARIPKGSYCYQTRTPVEECTFPNTKPEDLWHGVEEQVSVTRGSRNETLERRAGQLERLRVPQVC